MSFDPKTFVGMVTEGIKERDDYVMSIAGDYLLETFEDYDVQWFFRHVKIEGKQYWKDYEISTDVRRWLSILMGEEDDGIVEYVLKHGVGYPFRGDDDSYEEAVNKTLRLFVGQDRWPPSTKDRIIRRVVEQLELGEVGRRIDDEYQSSLETEDEF
jgi:hypothetical protein